MARAAPRSGKASLGPGAISAACAQASGLVSVLGSAALAGTLGGIEASAGSPTNVTRAHMSVLSDEGASPSATRTGIVAFFRSTAGTRSRTDPCTVTPGSASSSTSADCPGRSLPARASGTSASTSRLERSTSTTIGAPPGACAPASSPTSASFAVTTPANGARTTVWARLSSARSLSARVTSRAARLRSSSWAVARPAGKSFS